jgi:hypothetical protein
MANAPVDPMPDHTTSVPSRPPLYLAAHTRQLVRLRACPASAVQAWIEGCSIPAPAGDEAEHTIGERWAHFEACAGLQRLASLQASVTGLLGQLSASADMPGA